MMGRSVGIGFNKIDGDVATLTLEHMATPLLEEKLVSFFREAAEVTGRPNASVVEVLGFSGFRPAAENAYALVETYKPAEAAEPLYELATGKVVQKRMYNKMMVTNRTRALGAFVAVTKQDARGYHFQMYTPTAHSSAILAEPSEVEENADVAKAEAWWKANGQGWHGADAGGGGKG